MLYLAQLRILVDALNSFLAGVTVLCVAALFTTAVAYNAILFALLVRSESLFACFFLATASALVTLVGFSLFASSEAVEAMSKNLIEELHKRASRWVRQRMVLRCFVTRANNNGHPSSYFGRNFQRMPFRLEMKPFRRVEKGTSVTWMQQIIENTVNAIFMVSLGDSRMLF